MKLIKVWGVFLALTACAWLARADIIEMQNGDRYTGKLLSVGESTVILQNDNLGRITLPRAKVAGISFVAPGAAVASAPGLTNPLVTLPPQTATKGASNSALPQLASQSALIKKVENEYLSGADPAAHDKFNELISGLISGKLSVEDIRREAQTTADHVRAMRKDMGEDAAGAIDGYLAILDQFLRETPPATPPPANNGTAKPKTPAPSDSD